MAMMNIVLPDLLKNWVEARAKVGLYADAGDYVRDLIRRDQEKAAALSDLERLIEEGFESGVGDRSMDDIIADARIQAVSLSRA